MSPGKWTNGVSECWDFRVQIADCRLSKVVVKISDVGKDVRVKILLARS
jgi:hypothetical protein